MSSFLFVLVTVFYSLSCTGIKKVVVIDFVDRLVTRNRYYTCLPLYHQNLIRFEGKIVEYQYNTHHNFDARGHWPQFL